MQLCDDGVHDECVVVCNPSRTKITVSLINMQCIGCIINFSYKKKMGSKYNSTICF